jgi:hypothetical protein
MRTHYLLAALLMIFSAQSFATGTIECTAEGTNIKGKKVTMNLLANKGYEDSELAGDLLITPNVKTNEVFSIPKNKVTTFKSTEKGLVIRVVDAKSKRNVLELTYSRSRQQGSMVLNAKGAIQSSSDVSCEYDE